MNDNPSDTGITEDRAELESWRRIAATTPGRVARTLLDACNAIEALLTKVEQLSAERAEIEKQVREQVAQEIEDRFSMLLPGHRAYVHVHEAADIAHGGAR